MLSGRSPNTPKINGQTSPLDLDRLPSLDIPGLPNYPRCQPETTAVVVAAFLERNDWIRSYLNGFDKIQNTTDSISLTVTQTEDSKLATDLAAHPPELLGRTVGEFLRAIRYFTPQLEDRRAAAMTYFYYGGMGAPPSPVLRYQTLLGERDGLSRIKMTLHRVLCLMVENPATEQAWPSSPFLPVLKKKIKPLASPPKVVSAPPKVESGLTPDSKREHASESSPKNTGDRGGYHRSRDFPNLDELISVIKLDGESLPPSSSDALRARCFGDPEWCTVEVVAAKEGLRESTVKTYTSNALSLLQEVPALFSPGSERRISLPPTVSKNVVNENVVKIPPTSVAKTSPYFELIGFGVGRPRCVNAKKFQEQSHEHDRNLGLRSRQIRRLEVSPQSILQGPDRTELEAITPLKDIYWKQRNRLCPLVQEMLDFRYLLSRQAKQSYSVEEIASAVGLEDVKAYWFLIGGLETLGYRFRSAESK